MMEKNKFDDFCREFPQILFREFPEFEKYKRTEEHEHYDETEVHIKLV